MRHATNVRPVGGDGRQRARLGIETKRRDVGRVKLSVALIRREICIESEVLESVECMAHRGL